MDKGTLIRTSVLGVAFLNQLLAAFGQSPLPFDEQFVELLVSTGFTFVAGIVAWFKNNYVTEKGKRQEAVLNQKGLK